VPANLRVRYVENDRLGERGAQRAVVRLCGTRGEPDVWSYISAQWPWPGFVPYASPP